MQSLFLTEDDTFEVKLFVAEDENKTIYCDKNIDAVKLLMGERDLEIEEYSISFKKPSFGDLITLTDLVMQVSNKITGDVNPLTVKLKTMSHLLRDWSFVDKNGIKVPVKEENMMKLDPIIAVNIGMQFDEVLEAKEEEDKKEDTSETKE